MKIMHRGKKKHGFTLVELMIVVIIVGILAAVALALYRGYVRKAIATEGTAGLGTIRTALRVVYAESSDYRYGPVGSATEIEPGIVGGADTLIPGIAVDDLDGTYFDQIDYTVVSIGKEAFSLQVLGTSSSGYTGGAGEGDSEGIKITMDHQGTIVQTYVAPP